jgi:hypothetical protein
VVLEVEVDIVVVVLEVEVPGADVVVDDEAIVVDGTVEGSPVVVVGESMPYSKSSERPSSKIVVLVSGDAVEVVGDVVLVLLIVDVVVEDALAVVVDGRDDGTTSRALSAADCAGSSVVTTASVVGSLDSAGSSAKVVAGTSELSDVSGTPDVAGVDEVPDPGPTTCPDIAETLESGIGSVDTAGSPGASGTVDPAHSPGSLVDAEAGREVSMASVAAAITTSRISGPVRRSLRCTARTAIPVATASAANNSAAPNEPPEIGRLQGASIVRGSRRRRRDADASPGRHRAASELQPT